MGGCIDPTVTEEYLKEACGRVGNTEAPGLDGIPNIALKGAINAAPGQFLDGEKPPDEPSSDRPLCVPDTAGKINESIMHQRIEAVVEPLLAANQYGFRRGRTTFDAIDLVVSTAREAISGTRLKGRIKKYCLVTTLDIKNAFNSAKWDCIMEALDRMNVPGYLPRMVESYFPDKILMYDTETGPKEYRVTGGVFQDSVLGSLVEHHICRWMNTVDLKLPEHKTEAVLITTRKRVETIKLQVGKYKLTSQPFTWYLGGIIDIRLSFKEQAEHASSKASRVRMALSRLMPNVGGPKQRRKALLSSVVTSVITYGIAIWANALLMQESRRRVALVYRLSALRVASAYCPVSEDAMCVIAGMLPLEVLAEERRSIYRQRR
ncbi:uncharacterized protein LOC107042850 [Diachasma alloeum]|uniref:uncharacterized protein LOC107042850 n=1 Tax=Diachasma alloeum TaxID=454923 RepID=UPI0007382ED1|nr:uncharacterized protein LOC107042850 [Diachasma alloeum]